MSLDDVTNATSQNGTKLEVCSGLKNCLAVCSAGKTFPFSGYILPQLLMIAFYGVTLAIGAKLIAEGSECLLEIMDPGIIGALLLPILGAVPDAAIVVVSGATGSNLQETQTQLAVGVGTLAGSTIMLLTIPWAVGLWLARCDVRHDEAVDGVLTRPWSLTETGATVDEDTPTTAKIMVATSAGYLVVQGVAFKYAGDWNNHLTHVRHLEKWFAFAGMIVCFVGLVGYCGYQIYAPNWQRKQMAQARREYAARQLIAKMMNTMAGDAPTPDVEAASTPLLQDPEPDMHQIGNVWRQKAKAAAAAAKPTESKPKVQEDEEEEEKPADWKAILLQAFALLTLGVGLVTIFSDPMVEVLNDFADTVGIAPFYVSFVVCPICSNASELISSLIFAARKKRSNTSLTYGQLYGAAVMNNTMVLGIFFALIFFKGLAWTYSVETLSILLVTVAVGVIGMTRTTYRTWLAFVVLALYPLSLLFVYVMEKFTTWT